MTASFRLSVGQYIKKRRTTKTALPDREVSKIYVPLVIRSMSIDKKKDFAISKKVVNDLQTIRRMYVKYAGYLKNDPDNVWHPGALMFFVGEKNGVLSHLELIKNKPNGQMCAYLCTVSPLLMAKGMYKLIKSGFSLGAMARIVLCRDKYTNTDDHIFSQFKRDNLPLITLSGGAFSIKSCDNHGDYVDQGYKII